MTDEGSALPPAAPAPDAGRVLGGKFQVIRQIGAGGMGVVFEGKDLTLDRPVAVKRMRPDVRLSGRDKRAFLREAKTSAALHHPFIVDIYAILDDADGINLIFEYVDGKTLAEIIDEYGPLPAEKLKVPLKCVCEGLAFAHSSKVVHRDLKPSNIMLTRQGYAKVMDFGIARQIKDTASRLSTGAASGAASGTLPYMAPEQELGKADSRSDVFSLGATVYEVLSGEPPFIGPDFYGQKEKRSFPPILEIAPETAPELAQAVERCLSFDAKERFQSVEEFAAALSL